MNESKTLNPSRRGLLTAGAGAVGFAAGMAGGAYAGAALADGPADIVVQGRRRFEGQVIAITGATSGIGRAAAVRFANEGGRVAFCGRREHLGAEVEASIRQEGGEATYIRADVRNEADVRAFVEKTVARYGHLDVAFNNAGITVQKPLHEYSVADFDDIQNTNVRGIFLAMKYQIPEMLKAGGGVIVVTSSAVAVSSGKDRSIYAASKRAVLGLVQGAAIDYAGQNIRINALLPGTTDTDFVRRLAGFENAPDAAWAAAGAFWAKSALPVPGRLATADEMANLALMLASKEYSYMNGAQLLADGAQSAA